jgi:hypothetical protein
MPKRYFRENWNGTKVEIKFKGIRHIFPFVPYYVGDKVKFHIKATRLNPNAQRLTMSAVWENLPQYQKPILLPGLERKADDMIMEADCEGEIISQQGNITYYFGHLNYFGDGFPIITAEVIDKDNQLQSIMLVLIGAVFSCLIGVLLWLLGFITIKPFWEIWIPK